MNLSGAVRLTPPLLAPQHRKTFSATMPKDTHTRPATCAEVDCENRRHGWQMVVDLSTPHGPAQANYLRNHSGRRFTVREQPGAPGQHPIVIFTFPAGQNCFTEHRVALDKPAVLQVKEGDWRGNPRGTPPITCRSTSEWVDRSGTLLTSLREAIERG